MGEVKKMMFLSQKKKNDVLLHPQKINKKWCFLTNPLNCVKN
jgi:hypothetical protein